MNDFRKQLKPRYALLRVSAKTETSLRLINSGSFFTLYIQNHQGTCMGWSEPLLLAYAICIGAFLDVTGHGQS